MLIYLLITTQLLCLKAKYLEKFTVSRAVSVLVCLSIPKCAQNWSSIIYGFHDVFTRGLTQKFYDLLCGFCLARSTFASNDDRLRLRLYVSAGFFCLALEMSRNKY